MGRPLNAYDRRDTERRGAECFVAATEKAKNDSKLDRKIPKALRHLDVLWRISGEENFGVRPFQ